MQQSLNQQSLLSFEQFVNELRKSLPRQYDRLINSDLARQQWNELLLRNTVTTAKNTYEASFEKLQNLSFAREEAAINKGLSTLTTQALNVFKGMLDELLQYALQRHRTSCALSNFPDEHKPDEAYIAEVKNALAQEWREFALQVNAFMIATEEVV